MKLLIVICLVAAAFAAPSVRLRRTILPGDARYNPEHHQVGNVEQHHQNEFNTARALEGCGVGLSDQAPAPAPATPVESSPVQEQQAAVQDTTDQVKFAEHAASEAAVESSEANAEKVQAVAERTLAQSEVAVDPVPTAVQPEQQFAVKNAQDVHAPAEHSHVDTVAETPLTPEKARTTFVAAEQSQYPVSIEQSQRPVAVEQSQYPVSVDQSQHPVAVEQSQYPVSAEQTQVPVPAEQTQAVVPAEQSQVEQAAVEQSAHPLKGKTVTVPEHAPVAADQQVPAPVQPHQYGNSVPAFHTKSAEVEQAHPEDKAVVPEAPKSSTVDSGFAKAKALEAEPAKPYSGPGSSTYDSKYQSPVAPYPALGAYTPGLPNAWDHARFNPSYNAGYPGYTGGYTGAYNGQWNNNYAKLGYSGAYPTGAYPGAYPAGAYPGSYFGATPYSGAYNPIYKGKTVLDPHAPLAPFPQYPLASNYPQTRTLGYPGVSPYHFPAPVVPVVPVADVAHKHVE